jgi:hypothetical protein
MVRGEKQANRKVLLAVSFVFSGLVIAETAATADDAGPADAGTSADAGNATSEAGYGNYGPNKSNICSVAPHGVYGGFGAGCC